MGLNCLGKIRRHSFVGQGMSLGVGFEISKTSCHSNVLALIPACRSHHRAFAFQQSETLSQIKSFLVYAALIMEFSYGDRKINTIAKMFRIFDASFL